MSEDDEAVVKQAIGCISSTDDTIAASAAAEAEVAEMTTDAATASTLDTDEGRCTEKMHPTGAMIRDHSPASSSSFSPPSSFNRDQHRLDSKLSTKASAFSIDSLLRRSSCLGDRLQGNHLQGDQVTVDPVSRGGSHFDVHSSGTGDLCCSREATFNGVALPSSPSSSQAPHPPTPPPSLRPLEEQKEKLTETSEESYTRGTSPVLSHLTLTYLLRYLTLLFPIIK